MSDPASPIPRLDLIAHAQTYPRLRNAMHGLLDLERAFAQGVDLAQLFHTAHALYDLEVCALRHLDRLSAALRTASWRLHTLTLHTPHTPADAPDDAFMRALAATPFAARLEALHLRGARVSAACVHRLMRDAAFPRLRTFDLARPAPAPDAPPHPDDAPGHALARDPAFPDTLGLDARIQQRITDLRDHDRYDVMSVSLPADHGQGMAVVDWRVAVGELVATGDVLAELEGDKVALELTSPRTGVVLAHRLPLGEPLPEGLPVPLVTLAAPLPSVRFDGDAPRHSALPPLPQAPPPGTPPSPHAHPLDARELIALAHTPDPTLSAWGALCTRLALLHRLDPLQAEQLTRDHLLPALDAWPDRLRRHHAVLADALRDRPAASPAHRLARSLVLDAPLPHDALPAPARAALRALTLRLPDHAHTPDAPIFDLLDAPDLRLDALHITHITTRALADGLPARLARAPACARLRRLTLTASAPAHGLSDAGLDALLSAPFSPHLHTLSLRNTALSQPYLRALARRSLPPALRRLDLSVNASPHTAPLPAPPPLAPDAAPPVVVLTPDVSEHGEPMRVARWLCQLGGVVTLDQPLAELESAKVVVDVPSTATGVIVALYAETGAIVDDDAPLLAVQPLRPDLIP